MAKKTYNEKLNNPGDLPKIVDLSDKPEAVKYMGAKMFIAAPMQYNTIIAKIPQGKLATIDRVRAALAAQAGANITCPLTAGIFTNICAHASEERDTDKIPWWRMLKAKGELNEKYPGSIDTQKQFLEAEGHTITQKGKHFFVVNYEAALMEEKN